jgi:hypothetical protein
MYSNNKIVSKGENSSENSIFDKRTVIELAENQLTEVCGGSGCLTGLPTGNGTSFALV